MRLRLTPQGFWVRRAGRGRLYAYGILWPLLAGPLVFLIALLLATNREARLFEAFGTEPQYAAQVLARHSRVALQNLGALEPVATDSRIPTVELIVARSTLERMQEAIHVGDPQHRHEPDGDRPYFRAHYRDESKQIQVARVAYRGANPWHHWPDKPSLRIKIRRSDIARGFRYVELQRPEDVLVIRSWLPTVFAREIGLMHELREPVRVFINRKYRGVYERTTRAGDALAAANGRVPGTFFKGEAIFERRHINLWAGSAGWQISGRRSPDAIAQFDAFLALLREPASPENLRALRQVMDADAYARWAALMALVGSTHTNQNHNQVFFVNGNRGRLEPVVWDVNGYGAFSQPDSPVDVYLHPVIRRWAADPRWVHRRNEHLYDLLESIGSERAVQARLATQGRLLQRDLLADAHLGSLELESQGWAHVPYGVRDIEAEQQRIAAWTRARNATIRRYLAHTQIARLPAPPSDGWLYFQVGGTAGIRVDAGGAILEGRGPDGAIRRSASLLLLPAHAHELRLVLTALPRGGVIPEPHTAPAPFTYAIRAPTRHLTFVNAVTGEPVRVSSRPLKMPGPTSGVRVGQFLPAMPIIHPWLFPQEPTGEIQLGPGVIELREDLRIGPHQTLRIVAGTRVRLHEGISIFSRGRTRVEGTPDAPVIIEAATPEPWGTFALSGAATAGSAFTHMRMDGGSVGRDGWQAFKGMLSVYDCPRLTLEHCWFGANAVGDDAVNLAKSHIAIADCTWEDARSDALDLDICRGVLERCVFRGSGNDALDLMTSHVRVYDSHFAGSGDKGISVGEGTVATIERAIIEDCRIGIEIKDGSRALVTDSTFQRNVIAWHGYQKKWEFPGLAKGVLVRCELRDSLVADAHAERRSRLYVVDTAVGTIKGSRERVVTRKSIPLTWDAPAVDLQP